MLSPEVLDHRREVEGQGDTRVCKAGSSQSIEAIAAVKMGGRSSGRLPVTNKIRSKAKESIHVLLIPILPTAKRIGIDPVEILQDFGVDFGICVHRNRRSAGRKGRPA
jgi:hypothetical protein